MNPIDTLLVPTDFSPCSEAAAARAVAFASSERASIHLLHAVRFPLTAGK